MPGISDHRLTRDKISHFLAQHSPLIIFGTLCLVFALVSPAFRSTASLQQIPVRTATIAIMAIGELLVILTAGIDLSVGSVAALAGVAGCLTMTAEPLQGALGLGGAVPVVCGVLAGSGVGLLCGIINGFNTAKLRIPAFISTLGMMMGARGVARLLTEGQTVRGFPEAFAWLGGGESWLVPAGLSLAVAVLVALILGFTPFGRALYAIGGNREAARLSGLAVDRVRIAAFAISGTCAGFTGMIIASRVNVAAVNAAETYELDAIAACVIGGASLMGGEGGSIATLAGALIIIVLRKFCTLNGWDENWQLVIVGLLVIILVCYDNWRKRRAGLLKD